MAERLTITGLWRNDRTSSAGKPYVGVSLKTKEYGDRYLSCFGAEWNAQWKVGDTIEVTVKKKPGIDKKTGKPVEYLNIEKPNPIDDLVQLVMKLQSTVYKLQDEVAEMRKVRTPVPPLTPAQLEAPPDDDLDAMNAALAAAGLDDDAQP